MEFQGEQVTVDTSRQYTNGRVAIQLISVEDNEPYAVASVNVPDARLESDEVIIKDYSENEGMLEFLLQNNIVTLTDRKIQSGWVTMPVCKLIKS
jgi:hypothetical protein